MVTRHERRRKPWHRDWAAFWAVLFDSIGSDCAALLDVRNDAENLHAPSRFVACPRQISCGRNVFFEARLGHASGSANDLISSGRFGAADAPAVREDKTCFRAGTNFS